MDVSISFVVVVVFLLVCFIFVCLCCYIALATTFCVLPRQTVLVSFIYASQEMQNTTLKYFCSLPAEEIDFFYRRFLFDVPFLASFKRIPSIVTWNQLLLIDVKSIA